MKVALVGPHPPVDVHGVVADGTSDERRLRGLASSLTQLGNDVTVFTRSTAGVGAARVRTAAGYLVAALPAGVGADGGDEDDVACMGELARGLDDSWTTARPDVVHADSWTYGIAAQLAANHHGVPTVHTFLALSSVQQRRQNRRVGSDDRVRMEKALARNASWVTASCSEDVDELMRLGRPRGRTSVLARGIDTDVFSVEGPVAARTEAHRVLVVARNLRPHKNIDVVIRAMTLLTGTELVVVGGPPRGELSSDAEASRLHRLAVELGVAGRVHFTGVVPLAEMPALLRSADVLVCASAYEPFGLPVVEAMACGVPVVASNTGGMVDTVVQDVTGLLLPTVSPRAVAQAVRNVLRQGVLRRGMGFAGRARVASRYGWERVGRDTEVVYERLVASPHQSFVTGS